MRQRLSWARAVVLCLLCSLGLEAQQLDSSVANNPNLSASSQTTGGTFPRLVKFTGGVKDLAGNVPTGVVGLTFSLYELPEGGSPLWVESQSLSLDSLGRYTALLGASSPGGLPLDLFTTGKALWLGVQPQLSGVGEQPRVLLVAVPYALKASDSDTLGGKPASAYALAGAQTLVVPAGGAATSSPSTTNAPSGSQAAAAGSNSASPETACTAVTSDGTATANTVAKFTGPCNVENSLLRDNGTGVAVGGTSPPDALLDIQYTSTATSGLLLGQRVLGTFNPASTSSASNVAAYSEALIPSGNKQNFTGYIAGMNYEVNDYGTGTLASGYGLGAYVINRAGGTIRQAYGLYAEVGNGSTGDITNGYGLYVSPPPNSAGGTINNYTGVYIGNPTAVTGAYGLYSAGGLNYFGGNVGIGTTAPGANLEVNGTTKFDGLATFAAGQTFPIPSAGVTNAMLQNSSLTVTANSPLTGGGLVSLGGSTSLGLTTSCSAGQVLQWNGTAWVCATPGSGTITGVTAGTDLTGGGASGNVTLNLDTTKVPQLNSANTFTGNQTVNGNLGVTGAATITGIGSFIAPTPVQLIVNSGGAGPTTMGTISGNSSTTSGSGGLFLAASNAASIGNNTGLMFVGPTSGQWEQGPSSTGGPTNFMSIALNSTTTAAQNISFNTPTGVPVQTGRYGVGVTNTLDDGNNNMTVLGWIWQKGRNYLQSNPSNPTSTSSTSFVMMGLGSTLTLTPNFSGTVIIRIDSEAKNTVDGNGIQFEIFYGTGTAPSNGSPTTGTQVGPTFQRDFWGQNATVGFGTNLEITGLTVGTTYWFDIALRSVGTGSSNATIQNFEFYIEEI